MKSIKLRLCILLTAVATITAGGVSAVTYGVVRRSLYSEFDRSLRGTTSALHALTEFSEGKVMLDSGPATLPQFKIESRKAYFILTSDKQQVIGRSANFDAIRPTLIDSDPDKIINTTIDDTRAAKQLVTIYKPRLEDEKKNEEAPQASEHVPSTQPATVTAEMPTLKLVVVEDCEAIVHTLNLLATVLIGATAGFAALAGAGSYLAVSRGLRPLHDLSTWTSRINARSLNERLTVADWPPELTNIAERLNSLLARLQESFDRERRFSGNISHELRTPVAELQTLSDIAGRWPDDPVARQHLLLGSAEIAAHMTRLINTMLLISRLERGDQIELETLDLTTITIKAIERHTGTFQSRGMRVRSAIDPAITCQSNGTMFTQILDNLLANAASHAPEGSTCQLHFTRNHGGVLTISNPAPDLAQEDLPKLTEPLWRKEASRTNQSHSGLGLHLVKLFCEALGAKLAIALNEKQQLQIQIQFNQTILGDPPPRPAKAHATAAAR